MGNQNISIVAQSMANILTTETFVNTVGGPIVVFELHTIWLSERYSRPYCREWWESKFVKERPELS